MQGWNKIMIFNLKKKQKKSDFFDLNRIKKKIFFAFFSAVVHCCCNKPFKLHCELHIAQN